MTLKLDANPLETKVQAVWNTGVKYAAGIYEVDEKLIYGWHMTGWNTKSLCAWHRDGTPTCQHTSPALVNAPELPVTVKCYPVLYPMPNGDIAGVLAANSSDAKELLCRLNDSFGLDPIELTVPAGKLQPNLTSEAGR